MITCPSCRHANPVGTPLCSRCGAKLPTEVRTPAQEISSQLLELIQDGRKIEAVKLYREHTGTGLMEARLAIEALEQGKLPPSTETSQGDWQADVLTQLAHHRKIAAIKIYREHTGVGLKEAKEAVEKLAALHGIQSASGCSSSAAAVFLVLVLVYILS